MTFINRGQLTILGALSLFVAGTTWALMAPKPAAGPATETVKPAPFDVVIKGVGDLIPKQRKMVAAPFSGKLNMLAPEGKEVKAGEVIARLDTHEIEENKQEEELKLDMLQREAQANAAAAERDRKKLLTELKAAQDDLALKRLELGQMRRGTPASEVADLTLKAEQAEKTYENTRREFALREGLLAKGIIRPVDLADFRVELAKAQKAHLVAKTALEIAKNGYSDLLIEAKRLEVVSAETTLGLVEGKLAHLARTRGADSAIAQAEIDFSRARVGIFDHRIAASVLKAPNGGVVVFQAVWMNGQKKKVQVGDEVRSNRPFMEVADVSAIVIKTDIEEVDIGRVKPGLPVRIRVESVAKTFDGTLARVGVLATEKPNLVNTDGAPKVFEALVETRAHSSAFRPGMTVDLETLVRHLPDALTVPNKALATIAGQTTVFVKRPDGAIEKRVVTTGDHDDARTVVTAGLAAGELVLVERLP